MKMQAAAATAQIPAPARLGTIFRFPPFTRAPRGFSTCRQQTNSHTHTHTLNVETAVNQFPTELLWNNTPTYAELMCGWWEVCVFRYFNYNQILRREIFTQSIFAHSRSAPALSAWHDLFRIHKTHVHSNTLSNNHVQHSTATTTTTTVTTNTKAFPALARFSLWE